MRVFVLMGLWPVWGTLLIGGCLRPNASTCTGDDDCPTGAVCRHNKCYLVDANGLDSAGVDAVAPDTVPDLLPVDAGVAADRAPYPHDAQADGSSDGSPGDRGSGEGGQLPDTQTDDSYVAGDAAPRPDAMCSVGSVVVGPIIYAPEMRKNRPTSPFATAPRFVSSPPESICARGDVLVVPRGEHLGDHFYEHFDAAQGTIVFWATPEWDSGSLVGSRRFFTYGDFWLAIKDSHAVVNLNGTTQVTFQDAFAGWTAGSSYFVALRWDSHSELANGFVSLTVDGHTYVGQNNSFAPAAPAPALIIGGADEAGSSAFGGSLAGLTIFRRPLSGSPGGIQMAFSNEIGKIYNGGSGVDPSEITGSWDVVFALPTASTATYGENEAWSHPHGSSLVGPDGFTVDVQADWQQHGTAFVINASPVESIFGSALSVSTSDSHGGVSRQITMSEQQSVVIRAVVHSDGNAVPELVLQDSTNMLSSIRGTAQASREQPNVLTLTFQALQAGPVEIVLRNSSLQAGAFYVHQLEVYNNLLNTPSMETGYGDDPFLPTGWENEGLEENEGLFEAAMVHSGSGGYRINSLNSSMGFHQIRQEPSTQLGHFYQTGGFFYWIEGVAPHISVTNGCLLRQCRGSADVESKLSRGGEQTAGYWQHLTAVGRRHVDSVDGTINCHNNWVHWGGVWSTGIHTIVDDAYVVHLPSVLLAPTPAPLATATREGFLQIDRGDQAHQTVAELGTHSGRASVHLRYPWGAARRPLHCPAQGMLFSLYGDSNNFIHVRYAGEAIRIEASFGSAVKDWTFATPVLADGGAHTIGVLYRAQDKVELIVDGVATAGSTMSGAAFTTVPTRLIFGRHETNDNDYCEILVEAQGATFGAE